MSERPLVFVVVGPTAVGKTACAIDLAQALGTEIISADARQFYRGLAIGTAQPSARERAAVPHHFVDFLEPTAHFSAGAFAEAATEKIGQLHNSGHQAVVVVGGSGLYVKALVEGLNALPSDLKIRGLLNDRLATEGIAPLLAELQTLDPVHVKQMDTANPQRVVRALEVCLASGRPFSSFHAPEDIAERPFDVEVLGLEAPRDVLEFRIRERLSRMIEAGWEREARQALPYREENALQTVGYREWFQCFDGACTRAEAAEAIAVKTRQFAKRQMTWFRKMKGVSWFGCDACPEMLAHAQEICSARNIPFTPPVLPS